MEFFIHTTSHRLAGFLEGEFWKRSALQLSLSEPAIRQALAALGSLHENARYQPLRGPDMANSAAPDQLYSRAIRSTVEKASTRDAVPVVVMASIIFASFEFLRCNSPAATTHIASGINILHAWRQNARAAPRGSWGRRYSSYEAQFLDTELAPILTLFNLNASEFSPFPRTRLVLNAADDGAPKLAERFESLREARVGLVDLVTASASLFQSLDAQVDGSELATYNAAAMSEKLRLSYGLWKVQFNDLLDRCEPIWGKDEKRAANVIRFMQYSSEMGLAAYTVSSECDWDNRREQYERLLHLAETLVGDSTYRPDELSTALSLDFGLIYPMHAVAWKCRYPRIRRRALNLLLRSPRREWLLDARQYHAIFSRVMDFEEQSFGLSSDALPDEHMLLPEHVRVHDFFCLPQPEVGDPSRYAVTFMTKPEGVGGPWHFTTEHISLPTMGIDDMPPSNLLSCRRWASPDTNDPATAKLLKTTVFGPYASTAS